MSEKNGIVIIEEPFTTSNPQETHAFNVCVLVDAINRVSNSLRVIIYGKEGISLCRPKYLAEYYDVLVSGSLGPYGDFLVMLPWSDDIKKMVEFVAGSRKDEQYTILDYGGISERLIGFTSVRVKIRCDVSSAEGKIVERDGCYDGVAVGGTFDRLHAGHYLLLSTTLLSWNGKGIVVVGITGKVMLQKKRNLEMIYPFQKRKENVLELMTFMNPLCREKLDIVELSDPFGPTISVEKLDCIVVSQETVRGGEKINEIRESKKFNPLKIVVIPCLSPKNSDIKLSSSLIRDSEKKKN